MRGVEQRGEDPRLQIFRGSFKPMQRIEVVGRPFLVPAIIETGNINNPVESTWNRYATEFSIYDTIKLKPAGALWEKFKDNIPMDRDHYLDLGIGPGIIARSILERNERGRVTGIDISRPYLEQARENLATIPGSEGRFSLWRFDLTRPFPLPEKTFNVATANFVTQYQNPEGQAQMYRNVARVLSSNGVFLMNTFLEKYNFGNIVPAMIESAGGMDNPEIREGVEAMGRSMNIARELEVHRMAGRMHSPTLEELQHQLRTAGFRHLEIEDLTQEGIKSPTGEPMHPRFGVLVAAYT